MTQNYVTQVGKHTAEDRVDLIIYKLDPTAHTTFVEHELSLTLEQQKVAHTLVALI